MKQCFPLVAVALVLACSLPAAEPAKKPKTEIQRSMDRMDKAFKTVRDQVGDASKNANTLEMIALIRTEALKAQKLTPGPAAHEPEAAQPRYVENYRKRMNKLLSDLAEIEETLKANDNGKARELVENLRGFIKAAHKDFKKPKQEDR